MTERAYYAVPRSMFQAGSNRAMGYVHASGAVFELDGLQSRVLNLCHGARTLEHHADAAWNAGGWQGLDRGAIGRALDRLVVAGLLRTSEELRHGNGSPGGHGPAAPLDTLAVVTADRPRYLDRCVTSIVRHGDANGRQLSLIVVDGSSDETTRALNRACVLGVNQRTAHRACYVGVDEAAALRARLAATTGVPMTVLEFGLTPDGIGANRNLALLFAQGRDLVFVDDDVILEPWKLDDTHEGIIIGGHGEHRVRRHFRTREDALTAARRVDVDLLAVHGSLLGRRLHDLIGESTRTVDLQDACSHMVAAMGRRESEATVRITLAGVAGDAGVYCPFSNAFESGPGASLSAWDLEELRLALTSREVHRVARQPVVTHHPACMAYCMGVSNGAHLPPFMPLGRNEDGVFAAMLAYVDTDALFAHVPYGLLHDSDRRSEYADDERMPSARQMRLCDVVLAGVRTASIRSTAAVEERLQAIGRHLSGFGVSETQAFASFVIESALETRSRQLARLEARMNGAEMGAAVVLRQYHETLWRRLTAREFFRPIEFRDEGPNAMVKLQAFMGHFGQLLAAWPALQLEAHA